MLGLILWHAPLEAVVVDNAVVVVEAVGAAVVELAVVGATVVTLMGTIKYFSEVD